MVALSSDGQESEGPSVEKSVYEGDAVTDTVFVRALERNFNLAGPERHQSAASGDQLMKTLPFVGYGLILGALAGCEPAAPAAAAPVPTAQPGATAPLEALGRTRCLLNRRGIIAPAILRPVVEVLVGPGDRVTKGQVLIKLFDLEPQAKLRAREKDLRSIEARAQYSRRNLNNAEKAHQNGAMPENTYNEVRSTALSNEAQQLAAQAELALVQAELKLYAVTASIDGEVAWLDVSPGTVTWPGALIWGEIVDLRELDVRCELSPVQAEQVAVGQSAEVWLVGKVEAAGTGKVVLVGKVADRNSGLVPVVVRLANPQERLRAEVAVKVRFQSETGK
jgi:RND family efflux transporter MFP subunit